MHFSTETAQDRELGTGANQKEDFVGDTVDWTDHELGRDAASHKFERVCRPQGRSFDRLLEFELLKSAALGT